MVGSESTASGDSSSSSHQYAEAGRVDHLIGQEEVVTQAGSGHSLHLTDGGAGKRAVTQCRLAGGQLRALVGLDVRPKPSVRGARRSWSQIAVQDVLVDDQGRRGELR